MRLIYTNHVYKTHHCLYEIPKCPICLSNDLVWCDRKTAYNNTCINNECRKKYIRDNRDEDKLAARIRKTKETVSKWSQEYKDSIKEKIKKTNISKYGVDSYAKTQEFKDHMLNTYGYISPFSLKETHEKSKKTLIERTGYDHNFKIPEVKNKKIQTYIQNYGYHNPNLNPEIKKKIIDTNNLKYGGNSPMCNEEIQNKSKNTLFNNYGVYGTLSHPDIKKKYEDTMMSRFGYAHPIHNPSNLNKMLLGAKKYKEYYLPSGKMVYLQGYEDYVLEMILLKKYNEDDIVISNKEITTEIGVIYYIDDNNKRKYYPDFYIKSENKIIEVKGEYTFNINKKLNLLKRQSCIDNGLNFEFIIVDKNTYNQWKKNKTNT